MSMHASVRRLRERNANLTHEPITVRMAPPMIRKITKICDQYGLTRSELMRELMELGYEQFVNPDGGKRDATAGAAE